MKDKLCQEMVRAFTWMGQPIIQLPTDMFAIQELIWKIRPDFIIETGVAHGGSTLFYSTILHAIGKGKVIAIDIDIRVDNRHKIVGHPTAGRIILIEDDSASSKCYTRVMMRVKDRKNNMVILDSNHTHDHVLKELKLYAPLVSVGSYIIVMDTSVEFVDPKYIGDRPWGKGDSPYTAVQEFLKDNDEFVADKEIEDRILLTSAPGGWLRRIK